MYALFSFTPGSALLTVPMSCSTTGAATSVYRCMSRPSNNQPSQAAVPDRHWPDVNSPRRVASRGAISPAARVAPVSV